MSNSLGQSQGSGRGNGGGSPFYIGRVTQIVLNPYLDNTKTLNPDYNSAADIGKIRFDRLYSSVTSTKNSNENDFAYPMFSFVKQYPLIGEIVAIFFGPSEGLNDSRDNQKLFYMPSYALWNAVNHNVMPNIAEMSQFYSSYKSQPGYQGSSNSTPEFPKGYTFTESDIKALTQFEGDSILEGRFGQSIRFGSTVSKFKGFNEWSDTGANGSPITIIRNGQGALTDPQDKFATTVEDINTDGASIYMTSGQRIVMDDLNNFPQNTYGNSIVSTEVSNTNTIFQIPASHDYTSAADQDKYTFR
jgi:hypothetical protein